MDANETPSFTLPLPSEFNWADELGAHPLERVDGCWRAPAGWEIDPEFDDDGEFVGSSVLDEWGDLIASSEEGVVEVQPPRRASGLPEPVRDVWDELTALDEDDDPDRYERLVEAVMDQAATRGALDAAVPPPEFVLLIGPVPEGRLRTVWEKAAGFLNIYCEVHDLAYADLLTYNAPIPMSERSNLGGVDRSLARVRESLGLTGRDFPRAAVLHRTPPARGYCRPTER